MPGIDHRKPGLVVLHELRRAPGLKFLRLAVEFRDASLVHHPQPNVSFRIKSQVESAGGGAGFGYRNGVLHCFGGLGVELPQVLGAKIGIPNHAFGVDGGVMRHRLWTRQIVLGDDHPGRLALRPWERLHRILPFGNLAEIDRAQILRELGHLLLLRWRRLAHAGPHLRAQRRAALRVSSHSLQDLHELVGVVTRPSDALHRVAGDATQETLLLFIGSRHAD